MFRLHKLTRIMPNTSQFRKIFSKVRSSKDRHKRIRSSKEIFFPPIKLEGIKDKVALVTGATEAIGLRCIRELLGCGAKGVMIADENSTHGIHKMKQFAKEYGSDKVAYIEIDPANYIMLKNAFISTMNYYKSLDIVINCIKFRERNWEDQIDENIKGIVLSTQLSMEFMGRNNGGNGGILVNIISDYNEESESCPLYLAVEDFIVRFDRSLADSCYRNSDVKVLTICKATLDTIGCDLATVLTKGHTGCVWIP